MARNCGRSPVPGSSSRASHEAAKASSPKASIPNAAFTPGPWHLVENKWMEFVVVQTSTDRNVILLDDGESGPDIEFTEITANAHLIAAAPELLAELQQFVNGVETHMIDSPADDILANVTRRAKAAIAKALGQ